jgi:hypothetical protein
MNRRAHLPLCCSWRMVGTLSPPNMPLQPTSGASAWGRPETVVFAARG